MGMAFLASLVVHLVAIYTIPAVDLFSEGPGDGLEEIIEVDFMAAELPEEGMDALNTEDNQFTAANPIPVDTAPPPKAPVPTEELDIPASPPEIEKPLGDFTLLSQTLDMKPEFTIERKRPTPEPNMPVKRPSDIIKLEKKPAKQEARALEQPETAISQKPPVTLNQPEQEKPVAEERVQFPSGAPALIVSSTNRLPEKKPAQSPAFSGKREIRPLAAQDTPASARTDTLAGSNTKRRLVGLDKDSSKDENRFGIFTGEKFELPNMKDSVQEASATREEVEAPATEEVQQAQPLEVNTQIEGPLRGRALVYKPAPPQLTDIENDVELRLKFWVLPDGTIGEVIPLKRGDVQLERVAIAYLKKWQFQPLASDVPQQKIWGTIPIVFTLQ